MHDKHLILHSLHVWAQYVTTPEKYEKKYPRHKNESSVGVFEKYVMSFHARTSTNSLKPRSLNHNLRIRRKTDVWMTIEKCDQQRRRQSIVYRRLWTVKQTKPSEWASNDKTHTGTPIQCAFDGRVEIYSWYVGRARPQQNTHYMICTMVDDDVEGERAKSRPCNRDNSLIYVTTTNVFAIILQSLDPSVNPSHYSH